MTIQSRVIVFDLSKLGTPPPAINEYPAMHHLLDCERYVETGISINKVKKKMLSSSQASASAGECSYNLLQEVRPNYQGSFYFLTSLRNFDREFELSQGDKVEISTVFQGGYRSFCELDLIEIKRI